MSRTVFFVGDKLKLVCLLILDEIIDLFVISLGEKNKQLLQYMTLYSICHRQIVFGSFEKILEFIWMFLSNQLIIRISIISTTMGISAFRLCGCTPVLWAKG